jgi:hypothetical protein
MYSDHIFVSNLDHRISLMKPDADALDFIS